MGIRVNKPALGDIRGKVGDLVIAKWRNKVVGKSVSRKFKKKGPELKRPQRHRFQLVNKMVSSLAEEIFSRYYQIPKGKNMTGVNAAVSYHMCNAVVGDYPHYTLDPAKMRFSQPVLATENAWKPELFSLPAHKFGLKWARNSFPQKDTLADDRAIIICYHHDRYWVYDQGDQRSQLSMERTVPGSDTGDEVFIWLFFASADGKRVSETKYLGALTML